MHNPPPPWPNITVSVVQSLLILQNLVASVAHQPREIFGKVRDFYSKYSSEIWEIYSEGFYIYCGKLEVGYVKWKILYSVRFIVGDLRFKVRVTVTRIKQERTNQDRTKISPFLDFLLHFSIFLLDIFNIASQLSCEAMLKILKNVGEN